MKNFSIWKNDKKEKESEPDYRLTMKVDDKFVDIGAGWIKSTSEGKKYISVSLSKAYNGKNGWKLIIEDEQH